MRPIVLLRRVVVVLLLWGGPCFAQLSADVGRTFRESFQKALRGLEVGRFGFGCDPKDTWGTPEPPTEETAYVGRAGEASPQRVPGLRPTRGRRSGRPTSGF